MKFLYGFGIICAFLLSEAYSLIPITLPKTCPAERKEPWSYRPLAKNGPLFWGVNFTDCNLNEQSPIALNSRNAINDDTLEELAFDNYDLPITSGTILNNGHTIEVIPSDGIRRTILVNGVEYDLQQFHFHWGYSYLLGYRGSEHTLDGVQYAMEMHLVHTNENGEIAVVGVFLQEQSANNEELQKIVAQMQDVRYKNTTAQLQSTIFLDNLLPENAESYFRYQGSLTTPPCTEGVTWSVLADSISVGTEQLNEFQQLYSVAERDAKESCKLTNTYRTVQPRNNRQVLRSQ